MSLLNFGSTDTTDDEQPTTVTGEPYDITLDGEKVMSSDGKELAVRKGDELYAGAHLREQIESLYEAEDIAIPVGYHDDDASGVDIGRIPLKRLFVHLALTGITGGGKTTVARTIQLALAYAGEGFVAIDPKSDGDMIELVRCLPEFRMGDVIWVEPASETFEKAVTLNLLATPDADSQRARDAAAARQVDAVKSLFDTSEYWGPTMEFIVETLSRAMIRSPTDYALIDMPFILYKIEYLEGFADSVEDPFLSMAAQKLTDLDDQEILPVWKRMAKHMASATKRPIISERENTIDFEELLEQKKIVILQPPDAGGDISEFLALMYLERYWTTQSQRSRAADGHPSPYFAFVDESYKALTDNLDTEGMLARARSSRFSITLIAQYADQWHDEVSQTAHTAIKNNTKTKLALSVESKDSAGFMMESFRDHDAADLVGMDDYTMWCKLPLRSGGDSEHRLDTIPPMPPLRSAEEARERLRQNLEEYGKRPVTDEEIVSNLKVGTPADFAEMIRRVRGDDASADETTGQVANEQAILKAVLDESIHTDGVEPGGYVSRTTVEPRLRDYLNASDDGIAKVWDAVDHVPEDLLERERRDGETHFRTTPRGKTEIFASGDEENAGGPDHRQLLKDAYVPLTQLGLTYEIVRQEPEDTRALPDGFAQPESLRAQDTSDLSLADTAALYERFRADHPTQDRLTRGEKAPVEAEDNTTTKPGQTILSLAAAVSEFGHCLFIAYPDRARRVENILSNPPMVSKETDAGDRVFYNRHDLSIEGTKILRPAGPEKTVWRHEAATNEYVLTDSAGTEHARFDSYERIFTHTGAYPATSETVDDMDGWTAVKKPVIPEREFERPIEDLSWEIVVVAPEAVDAPLALRAGGEVVPLTADVEVLSQDDESGLDVDEAPAALYDLLCECGDEVTTSEAHELAQERGGDLLDVSRRSVRNYLETLVEADALSVDRSGHSNAYRVV